MSAADAPRHATRRFLLGFLLGVGAFQLLFVAWLGDAPQFATYMGWNASLAAALLRLVGVDASAVGTLLQGSGVALEVRKGCDGLQSAAIFAAAVLAFPAPRGRRLAGLALGLALLLALNLLRIATLFLAALHAPGAFESLHELVWPVLLIAVALLLWLAWVRRLPGAPVEPRAAA